MYKNILCSLLILFSGLSNIRADDCDDCMQMCCIAMTFPKLPEDEIYCGFICSHVCD